MAAEFAWLPTTTLYFVTHVKKAQGAYEVMLETVK